MNTNLLRALLVLVAATPLVVMAEDEGPPPQTFQSTNMADVSKGAPFTPANGAAFLVRSKNHLEARVMLADLVPGHAHTIWWMVFNEPSECSTHPCTPGVDFGTGRAAVFFGTGVIAAAGGQGGVVNIPFDTRAGGPPTGALVIPAGPESGLKAGHGFKAEVHLLMIDHGVPTAGFPNVPGSWAFEMTHPRPPGTADVRGALFPPMAPPKEIED